MIDGPPVFSAGGFFSENFQGGRKKIMNMRAGREGIFCSFKKGINTRFFQKLMAKPLFSLHANQKNPAKIIIEIKGKNSHCISLCFDNRQDVAEKPRFFSNAAILYGKRGRWINILK